MSTQQEHWAAEAVGAIISAATDRRETRATYAERSAALRQLVERDGPAWFADLVAELQAAAEAVNTRVERRVFDCHQGESGLFSLFARELQSAYLLIAPLFTAAAGYLPGVTTTTVFPDGRRFVTNYDFTAEGHQIRLMVDGLDHEPEGAARAIAEGWVRAVVAAHQR